MGSGWQTAMDHPIAAGAIVGVGSGLAAYGASAGLTALSTQYLGGAGTACIAFCDKAKDALQTAYQIGRQGEALSGLTKNTQRIESLTKTASYRTPDGLDTANKVLSEVKNVRYQSLTNQIKDFVQYSQQNGYKFELYTRPDTKLSTPLQSLIKAGKIIQKTLK